MVHPDAENTEGLNKVADELARGVMPQSIVYVSFTRVAAQVAKTRVLETFPLYEQRDFPNFGTIHSICYRLLGLDRRQVFTQNKLMDFAKEANYDLTPQDEEEGDPFAQAIPERPMSSLHDYLEFLTSKWKNSMIPDLDTAVNKLAKGDELPEGFSRAVLRTYVNRREEYKRENNLVDFSDMLRLVLERDLAPIGMRVLLLDEGQDTQALAWEVIRRWAGKAERTYILGDPFQTLFTWSASDPRQLIDFPADRKYTLKQSHRCPVVVHDKARKIVNRMKTRYPDDDFHPDPRSGGIRSANNFNLTDERTFWLFRTRYLLNQTYDWLLMKGVPFVTRRGNKTIFNRKNDDKRMAAYNLLRLARGDRVKMDELSTILDFIKVKDGGAARMKRGTKKKVRELADMMSGGSVKISDLPSLGFTDEFMGPLTGGQPLELLDAKYFPSAEKSYIGKVVRGYGLDALVSSPNLELATVHAIKGAEAPRVIIDPTLTRRPWANLMKGNEEEHRIAYVACTRSAHTLVILPSEGFMAYPY